MKIKNCCFQKLLKNKKICKCQELAEKSQPSLDLFLHNYSNSKNDNEDDKIKADFKQRKSKRFIELGKENKKPY